MKNQGKYFFNREKSGNYQGISFLDFCGDPGLEYSLLLGGLADLTKCTY